MLVKFLMLIKKIRMVFKNGIPHNVAFSSMVEICKSVNDKGKCFGALLTELSKSFGCCNISFKSTCVSFEPSIINIDV